MHTTLKIIDLIIKEGVEVNYNDPYIPNCKGMRHYPHLDMKSTLLTGKVLQESDRVLLVTDHRIIQKNYLKES